MGKHYDVVVVGGGVIGSSIAYFLTADPGFDGTALVVERDSGYTLGATSRSVGSIRQQFSTPENIQMSRFGFAFLKDAARHLAVNGEFQEISLVEKGYLFLGTEATIDLLKANFAIQRQHTDDIVLLSPAELKERFPWLNAEDLAGGAFGLRNEGWLDPYSLLRAFRRKARSQGVHYCEDNVTGLLCEGTRVAGVRLAKNGKIACGHVVNAAGIDAATVAEMAGLDLPVRPRKRCVFVFDMRGEPIDSPLVIDPTGMYMRPEGRHYICGIAPPEDSDPDCTDFEIDYALFSDTLWPLLAHRVPAFEAIKLIQAWAGHYDYNLADQNVILGSHPDMRNFHFANGFSGHGLQQAPAVGRAIAELLIHGEFRTLDLMRFRYERLLSGSLVKEVNVV